MFFGPEVPASILKRGLARWMSNVTHIRENTIEAARHDAP
jgi:hypothetical protein